MTRLLATVVALLLATPALAEGFDQIRERDTFVSVIKDRELTRFGIAIDVLENGRIEGRAFGRSVTGAWRWSDGYFCRDLFWGSRDLGANCQAVKLQGNTIRFISDQGSGEYADLYLR